MQLQQWCGKIWNYFGDVLIDAGGRHRPGECGRGGYDMYAFDLWLEPFWDGGGEDDGGEHLGGDVSDGCDDGDHDGCDGDGDYVRDGDVGGGACCVSHRTLEQKSKVEMQALQ